MNRVKLIIVLSIVLLALILVVQNIQRVDIHILIFPFSMPLIILLLFTMGVGFVLGVIYMTKKGKTR